MRFGVMTSGGDAPGMNPALRAVVRWAFTHGAEPWLIHEGYAGLIAGGHHVRAATWGDVSHTLPQGGTVLGTARCPAFREPDGRRAAVKTLLTAGLSRLVVIGGDGSLTGADLLRAEWTKHSAALVASGEVPAETAAAHPALRLVGLVGSIDNDMWGTDMTIGCDTALHRVVDAIDTLKSTAASHRRAFVVEVMGRRCGYLALAAALCTEADFVLIPEAPSPDWVTEMAEAVQRGQRLGHRMALVLVAEGAVDAHGQPIRSSDVRDALTQIGMDTRITVLGHVQRGGTPSAYDRIMSSVLGARAAEALMAMDTRAEPLLMTTEGDHVIARPLMHCVRETRAVGTAITEQRFVDAVGARGPTFGELLALVRDHHRTAPRRGLRLAVLHVGAPAPGMNPALRGLARLCEGMGVELVAFHEGFEGLVRDHHMPLDTAKTRGILERGGTVLGTNRRLPDEPQQRAEALRTLDRHQIDGIVLIGGFEGLDAAAFLADTGRPVAMIPATISNNVPGAHRTLGVDTALGAILEATDRLQTSAVGSRRRIFVVEVQGRRCGYLATAAGLGGGSKLVYTHEQGPSLARLQQDVERLNAAFDLGSTVGTVLVSDQASDAVDTQALAGLLAEESQGRFDTRVCVLGHVQQGGAPSPMDRLLGLRYAAGALDHVIGGGTAALMGIRNNRIITVDLETVRAQADLQHRRPDTSSFDELRVIGEALSLRQDKR